MREICQSGSEGGGAGNRSLYPYFIESADPATFSFCFSAARRGGAFRAQSETHTVI